MNSAVCLFWRSQNEWRQHKSCVLESHAVFTRTNYVIKAIYVSRGQILCEFWLADSVTPPRHAFIVRRTAPLLFCSHQVFTCPSWRNWTASFHFCLCLPPDSFTGTPAIPRPIRFEPIYRIWRLKIPNNCSISSASIHFKINNIQLLSCFASWETLQPLSVRSSSCSSHVQLPLQIFKDLTDFRDFQRSWRIFANLEDLQETQSTSWGSLKKIVWK